MTPIIAIPGDNREMDGYHWHATPTQFVEAALHGSGAIALVVPPVSEGLDIDIVLDRVDGVLISGSRTNVHPSRYGHAETEDHGPYDQARDALSLGMIRRAIDRAIPLLAICRGIQELNVAFGGTLATEIHTHPGRRDHRRPETDDKDIGFSLRHPVHVKDGTCLASILGAGPVLVNSLHRQAISDLAPGLQVEAVADDGTIEAVSVIDAPGFAVGVQWHPEYWVKTDAPSAAIFRAFGEAARRYAAGRGTTLTAGHASPGAVKTG